MGGQAERPSERRERVKSLDRMTEERKTPEMRAQMTDLERLRHSASHVLATAILKIWPEAQFAAGPPVENGFYYDVDLPHRISPDDFEKIEAEMKKEIKANHPFEKMEVSRDEGLAMGKKGRLAALSDRPQPSKFKIDIIENIPPGEKISLYRNGDFIDLCAGPHVMRTGNIGAFKLTSVASAYYKGDEKNPQLQRVYGTAFKTKKELDDYFAMLEEGKKRDHRKLGKELELFVFDDDVGPGLPMFLPRGAVIAEEYGTDYRYEKSGELFGLMRVRSLQMNDAHIYCTPEQFEGEFNAVNEMYLKYFKLFGIEKYLMRFSTHDPSKLGQKFVDEPQLWKQTEVMTRNVLKNSGINYVEVPNEAAFYGPKIDVQAWSVIGREFSIATNQVDFAQPRRFDLRYKDRDNVDKIPLCIHRAPLGTHERFIGFLIEHYAGNFPLWLSPEQVRILTIGDEPQLLDYSRAILSELRSHQVRAEIDTSTDKINGKIQRAEQMKVHTMFVIGKRDMEANAVSLRLHGKGNLGAKPRGEVIADLLSAIKERRA